MTARALCLPGERWRPVVGFEGFYSVSDFGRIRTEARHFGIWVRPARIHAGSINKKGYATVTLWLNGVRFSRRTHILVARAFLGPPPDRMEVAHWDGDAANARLDNLRYDTHSENLRDMLRHGTRQKTSGEGHYCAKLTAAQVLQVRTDTRSQRQIAVDYGVSQNRVSRIKRGLSWTHLPTERPGRSSEGSAS